MTCRFIYKTCIKNPERCNFKDNTIQFRENYFLAPYSLPLDLALILNEGVRQEVRGGVLKISGRLVPKAKQVPMGGSYGCWMFRPMMGSVHGPNQLFSQPVNREKVSLAWAEMTIVF